MDAVDGEGRDFPQLRVGVAAGPALSRAGDWFGRAVNLASRITGIARPGSVLAEREVRDAARESYRWSYAGERRLRGIRDPVPLFRARALEPASSPGGASARRGAVQPATRSSTSAATSKFACTALTSSFSSSASMRRKSLAA